MRKHTLPCIEVDQRPENLIYLSGVSTVLIGMPYHRNYCFLHHIYLVGNPVNSLHSFSQEELRSEKERRRQRRLYIEGLQELPNIDMKTPRGKSNTAGAVGSSKSSTTRQADRRQSVSLQCFRICGWLDTPCCIDVDPFSILLFSRADINAKELKITLGVVNPVNERRQLCIIVRQS